MFAEFNLDSLKNIPKYHTKWKLKEKDYVNELLTNDIEIDIIEMRKLKEFSKNKKYIQNKELENWIEFLTNPDEMGANVMEDVKEIKMAKKIVSSCVQELFYLIISFIIYIVYDNMEVIIMIKINVLNLLEQKGKTKYWLFVQMGMTYTNFNNLITNKTKAIKYENIEKLCNILECEPSDLFVKVDEDNSSTK